ncbi:MAG: hypothetical protein O7A69_15785 [SAR324 cluster bacterium]|nr:hypothetical protein [SAR324 cluster bacterium]
MESQTTGAQQQEADSARQLPDDFPQRIATKIVVTLERERDPEAALQQIGTLILRNLGVDNRQKYFVDAVETLLEESESKRYAALSYVSISLDPENSTRHEQFLNEVLDILIDDHMNIVKPTVQIEGSRKSFSVYARHLGEVFTEMIDMNSDLYETIGHIFSTIIRKEMAQEQADKEAPDSFRRISMSSRDQPKAAKKLFDEIVDVIHARGEFHSDSLNQQNPNEYMALLADRMRATRRYVIQDILNKQALAKKKEIEKELSERLASAEEIILATDSFKKALNLFWTEKLYNFKYLSVEKVRVTVQVSAIVLGILYFLVGYLELYQMMWWEGLVVAVGMYLYARFLCSRRAFRRFFPDDVSKELEVMVGSFTPTIRRMSKDQMDSFLVRQVKDPRNVELLPIISEFVKYVFAVMPERKSAIITLEELADIMENIELDVSRKMRISAAQNEF